MGSKDSGDIQEIKENVKNLSECLKAVVERIERLEGYHPAAPAREYKSPRFQQAENAVKQLRSPNPSELDDERELKTVTTKEMKTEPDGTTKQVTRTVTTAVVRNTAVQKAYVSNGTSGPQEGHLSYMDENPAATMHRIIGLRKPHGHGDSLGISVKEENGHLVISGIDPKSPIQKKGLLHEGDGILEINKRPVKTAKDFEEAIKASPEGISVKIIRATLHPETEPVAQAYLKPYFDYDPEQDSLIPSKEIGLPFKAGEVLEVLSKEDDKWWQARKIADYTRIGLVPSQALQESRCAAASPTKKHAPLTDIINVVKKKTVMYSTRRSSDFDKHDILTYEEVAKLTPYGRRVLLLLGAPGVGRRTLKARLLRHDPQNFATVIPCTSRAPRQGEKDGREYHFVAKEKMQKGIQTGEFMEWGEYNGNYYGTQVESLRRVIKQGKICVLDCSPQAIKLLYNSEFMPYIVFLSPPPLEELKQLYATVRVNALKPKTEGDLVHTCDESLKLETTYNTFFDLVLTNRNAEVTFRRLLDSLETLKTQQQWVPSSWLFG